MNCLLGKFGIMNDFCKTEIEIQDNCNIYKEVAQKLNFATNKIRIWTIQNELNENNTPNPKINSLKIDKIISNSEKIENIQSTILFIQIKGENEPLLMPLIALLVKIYTRVKENPMLYVGIIFVSPNKLIKEISEVIKNSLNIDSKYKVNVFHEKGPTEIFLLNENKSISKNSLNHGSFIILDVPRKVDWSYQITACKSFQENHKNQSNIIRYCDKMLDILPESPIDFSFLYYNTQIIELVDYNDGKSYGLFEIPSRISIFQLEGFISQYFGLILDCQRNKIIFFDEGPSLHPILKIKTKNKSPKKKLYSNTSSSNEFNDTHKIFFLIVDYNFVYSESYLSLMTTFTSQKPFNFCKTFNFFIDTNEENLISIKYIKINILDSFEDGNHNTKSPKLKIDIESLRCYWTSKETGLILSDFLNDDEEITKDDALTKILRVEVIPADQRKRKFNRLDVYQSYLNNNEKELIISGIPIILNVDRIEKSQNIKNKISNFFDFDSNSINLEKVQLYLPQNLENYGKSNVSIGNQLVNSIIPFDPSFLISNDQKLTFLRNKINSIFFITNFDKVNI
ncbi:hypothetical protein TRFO_41830 [Tritrichomonas foetus]|uniref:Ubiquitin carboxyl-terminal hydrolase 7 ICP0-binding domain-containing protein n=1 Tax=Tritrichomonas foetus TaxID=1144522 RepID=A0A1J4KYL9_9EUKA|nr:hypothetical protein TRFO_41830 [Tritrichomonas foetus]|eukprot:OHT16355.1 hypothetical protein TRFO_41830 [Tritrichomonas foetus]